MFDWRDIKEFFIDISKYLIVAVVVILILIYVATIQQIVGPSMKNNLDSGDMVLLNKLQYRLFEVKRNDIISFYYEDTKYLIKRVIGLPGEKIEYKDNYLYINNQAHEETFISTNTNDFTLSDLGYDIIPDDMYLVLGDNREDSMDSRGFGLIKKSDIIGKVFFRFWPLNNIKVVK